MPVYWRRPPFLVLDTSTANTSTATATTIRSTWRRASSSSSSAVSPWPSRTPLGRAPRPQAVERARYWRGGQAARLRHREAARDDEAERRRIDRDAGRALTPQYAAPEQLTGGPIGTAADVYSLGVSAVITLLTGHHPAGDQAQSYADLVNPLSGLRGHLTADVRRAG